MKNSTYIPFTEEQKRQAAAVDLEEFLRSNGEKLLRSGRDKRLASDHSVTIRGNQWYDHAAQRGGNPISFLQTFYGQSYPEAMKTLLGEDLASPRPAARPVREPPRPFALPDKNGDMKRVYAYLIKRRRLDREIVSYFARQGLLYEDAPYHNAVFVGTDENGTPRHAHRWSVNSFAPAFRQNVEGSDPRYSFHHKGTDGSLFVFEAPIDMLSFMAFHPEGWEESSYVACCGTSSLPVLKMLEMMPQTDSIFLCLDNDDAGNKTCDRMARALEGKGLTVERCAPQRKDWNEDLTHLDMTRREEPEICQTFYP